MNQVSANGKLEFATELGPVIDSLGIEKHLGVSDELGVSAPNNVRGPSNELDQRQQLVALGPEVNLLLRLIEQNARLGEKRSWNRL